MAIHGLEMGVTNHLLTGMILQVHPRNSLGKLHITTLKNRQKIAGGWMKSKGIPPNWPQFRFRNYSNLQPFTSTQTGTSGGEKQGRNPHQIAHQ